MERSSARSRCRSGGASVDDRLGQPLTDVRLALGLQPAQPIDRQPGRGRDEPRFGILDAAGCRLVPADVGVLDDVLGIRT